MSLTWIGRYETPSAANARDIPERHLCDLADETRLVERRRISTEELRIVVRPESDTYVRQFG
jgi:hypothetical protein